MMLLNWGRKSKKKERRSSMSRYSELRDLNWKFLSEYFEVDSSSVTGLIWKKRDPNINRWNEQYAGEQAGTIFTDEDGRKYCSVMLTVDGVERRISTWRAAYMISKKTNIKKGLTIGHIDGNNLNNDISNLKVCPHVENLVNGKIHCKNTSGVKGVHWDHRKQRWIAQITVKSKKIKLGAFLTKEEAVDARAEADKKYRSQYAR